MRLDGKLLERVVFESLNKRRVHRTASFIVNESSRQTGLDRMTCIPIVSPSRTNLPAMRKASPHPFGTVTNIIPSLSTDAVFAQPAFHANPKSLKVSRKNKKKP
jgi:hypothetical protein